MATREATCQLTMQEHALQTLVYETVKSTKYLDICLSLSLSRAHSISLHKSAMET